MSVQPCHNGMSVQPCHNGMSVQPCHNGMSVQPCHNGMSVQPYHHPINGGGGGGANFLHCHSSGRNCQPQFYHKTDSPLSAAEVFLICRTPIATATTNSSSCSGGGGESGSGECGGGESGCVVVGVDNSRPQGAVRLAECRHSDDSTHVFSVDDDGTIEGTESCSSKKEKEDVGDPTG
eukprot:GHVS01037316.1.p1 GENE.GHVS01037316.1~~GHVS01037316.1.p1  ORF type:complete len:186 (-),score=61.92 GHVS01037316.1:164-697(-)